MSGIKRTTTNTGQSVLSQLENLAPNKALCEYVWNAFDAGAKNIYINAIPNGMSGLSEISVSDDGVGIRYSDLDKTFDRFLDSQKKTLRTPVTRGRKGKGRFSFVKFADRARWKTSSVDGEEFSIELMSSHVNEYIVSQPTSSSKDACGTLVTFDPISIGIDAFEQDVVPYVQNDVSWLMLAHKDISVYINNIKIKPIDYISQIYSKSINDHSFDIKTVQWADKPVVEKSYIYFLNSNGRVVHKELSELNGKQFYCSAYVQSEWFDSFDVNNYLISESSHSVDVNEFKFILSYVRSCLREEYRKFKTNVADQLISQYLSDGIFPDYKSDNVMYNEFRRSQLIETVKVIYEAEPALFSKSLNKKQKKILIKLLDRIVETNNLSNLFDIFEGIIELSDAEVDKLSEVIRRSSLSNITKTISFINDRLDVLDYFSKLLEDPKKDTYEVKHIQKVIEENLWLFGEQYTLLASEEDKFDHALRVFLKDVKEFDEEHYNKYAINHPDKNKEMDIFAALKGKRCDDKDNTYFHCVVIELKRPSVKLTDKEFEQVKRYKNVISSHAEFMGDNTRWDFILVGNEISDSKITSANIMDEIESNKQHGEFGLVQKSGNKRIYIKTWKQIINEFELRYHELTDKLKLKELEIQENTPDVLTSKILELNEASYNTAN
ncbi:ATP-binding protein [Yersinia mollaretii]|uniref:ATP-binding protein n=1 Tax=Yersinia mollaretii TaxID=33060 RepID=UPI0011A60538|nr:ATP-binding protein [Yersinia mollaretii]